MQGRPARQAAFRALDPFKDVETVLTRRPVAGDEEAVWDVDLDFPEIPAGLVAQGSWRILRSEKWLYPQAVHLGEARAGSECLLQRCLRGRLRRARVLRLGDNMGVVLAFARKRAVAFQLLCQVRRSAALELACEIDVRDRWFPSELNPSDPPS